LFLHLKKHFAGKKFYDDDEAQEVMMWFKGQVADFYDSGIQKLVPRLNKCLDYAGDYVEKYRYVQAIHSQCRLRKLKMLYMFKTFASLLSGHASYNNQNTATQLSHRQLNKNEEIFGYGKLLRSLNRKRDINHHHHTPSPPPPQKKSLILSLKIIPL